MQAWCLKQRIIAFLKGKSSYTSLKHQVTIRYACLAMHNVQTHACLGLQVSRLKYQFTGQKLTLRELRESTPLGFSAESLHS